MANKKLKTDITVVLPIHELNGEKETAYFKGAVDSVANQDVIPDELIIVVPKGSDVAKTLKDYDFGPIKDITRIVENPGDTDCQTQINFGVENVKTEWFSFLEFDDEYSNKWFKAVMTYKAAHTDVDIFLPIVVDVSAKDGGFQSLTNEAVWANSFSDELGVLDNNALIAYQNFNIDGMTMKKETFDNFGGFKSNIKLTFIYEFLLRMTFNDARVFVIPRYGYKHISLREGSLFASYKDEMNAVEANWWLAQAKKEYYFPNERNIKYEETT